MKKFHKYLYRIASKEIESTLPQRKEVSWATKENYLHGEHGCLLQV